MTRKFWFLLGLVGALVLMPVYLVIDLILNGDWLSELKFTWSRVFTTRHGIALLYYKSFPLCVVGIILVSLLTGAILAIRGDKN